MLTSSILANIGILSIPLVSSNAVPEVFRRTAGFCYADNCLRAVRASGIPARLSTASADCSSFFVTTITPCPITSFLAFSSTGLAGTITTTTTTTSVETDTSYATIPTVLPEMRPRGLGDGFATCPASRTATKVPTYASACSGTARYSSACSCLGGIIPQTLILPASTTVMNQPAPTIVTSTEVDRSTTVITLTSTIFSRPTQSGTVPSGTVYEFKNNLTGYAIDIFLLVDPMQTRHCGGGGRMITNICGSFQGKQIMFDPKDNIGGANDCFYPDASAGGSVDFHGLAFESPQGRNWNLYGTQNNFFGVDDIVGGIFGSGGYNLVSSSSPGAACLFP